jgi:hypothetical protein
VKFYVTIIIIAVMFVPNACQSLFASDGLRYFVCRVEIRTVPLVRCSDCIVRWGRCQEAVGEAPPAGRAPVVA